MMQPSEIGNVFDWLAYGKERGWCSDPVCNTHEGLPMHEFEMDEWDEGGDPCITGIRLYWPSDF